MLCLLPAAAFAQTTQNYPDASGEISPSLGNFPHLDITSVDVTVDAGETNITFKINLNGSPVSTNWGKYMIGIRSHPGGATSGNGWGRPIHMAGGMTHWIGSWVDDGNSPTNSGGEVRTYSGNWSGTAAPAVSRDATGVTITTTTASLGLTPGEVFSFDVYSSGGGGGDGAVDALSSASTSITAWDGHYTTAVVSGTPNPARSFTMPGTPDYATWIAGFGLTGNDALPGTDYDDDELTNQEEFDLDIGLNPTIDDYDGDGLKDGWETLSGTFVSPQNSGTNPVNFDSDGDQISDGDEANGTGPSGYVQNPNIPNHEKIVVAGSFNLPNAWDPEGTSVPFNLMTAADTTLTGQYEWSLNQRFAVPKAAVSFKFTAGSWTTNWGAGSTAGIASPGGGNIDRTIGASGIHRFSFNSGTRAFSLTRATFANATAYLAAYGLSAGADEDGDTINNEDEFTANTDPYNADSDDDGLNDNVDPEPLTVAPESREVVFQVNMSVAIDQAYFTPGTSVVRVIGQFNGWSISSGVILADTDADGVYTGTLPVAGFEGTAFGGYKFYIDGGPGYETSADRGFNLGPDGVQQVLPVVYFSDIEPAASFEDWIAGFEGLADITRTGDPDGDGRSNEDEFLFGTSPASGGETQVTVTREANGLLLIWLQLTTGAAYDLEENDDIAGEWADGPVTPEASPDQDGIAEGYTRMQALIPFSIPRNFVRVTGTENQSP